MKKTVIIAALGLTAALSSFGQGSMAFNSYTAGPNSTGVKIYNVGGLIALSTGWTADLVWSMSPISDTSGNGNLLAGWNSTSVSPSFKDVSTSFQSGSLAGYFQSVNNFALSTYTAGTPVYFEILAYQTSAGSYANSLIRGHSSPFTVAGLTTGATAVPNMPLFQSFSVAAVPEPATLALAGLGGLASLVMLRRKKA
jgi:hypothetical protein